MYCISEQQIDFILNDISARGVKMEDLQLNLLDHICCIIEQQLEENGDFGQFYSATIKKFYKDELREIEEETISLLTNKNYYVMKKIMIYSGVFSATALTAGIIFKYLYMNGASILITLGIVTASLIFIPLLFVLKVKEKQNGKDKLLVGLGTLSAITIAMGILFKIQHWPGANMLSITSPIILMLVFLPIYFITGMRNPETKVNTIVTSILMIVGCGLFFSLTITQRSSRFISVRNTKDYLRNEQILANEQRLLEKYWKSDSVKVQATELSKKIYTICNELKNSILEDQLNNKKTDDELGKAIVIIDYPANDFFSQNASALAKLEELRKSVALYNASGKASNPVLNLIPVEANVIDVNNISAGYKVVGALNDFIQIQMIVLQNERVLASI